MKPNPIKIVEAVDDFIVIRVFENPCKTAQRWVGLNCFWFSRFLCVLAFISLALSFPHQKADIPIDVLFFIAICSRLFWEIGSVEERTLHDLDHGCGNIRRAIFIFRFLRLIGAFCFFILCFCIAAFHALTHTLLDATGMLLVASDWLLACTPLPPGSSKLGDFVRKLSAGITRLFSPEAQPA